MFVKHAGRSTVVSFFDEQNVIFFVVSSSFLLFSYSLRTLASVFRIKSLRDRNMKNYSASVVNARQVGFLEIHKTLIPSRHL